MAQEGYNKFFWGFLFIMFDFRIQGIDIMPNVIGYILFALGFQALANHSQYFAKAKIFNLIMIFISLFTIYQKPNTNEGMNWSPLGTVIGLVSQVLLLVVIYHLLMGTKEMASKMNRFDLMEEAGRKWSQFLAFQLATVLLFIVFFIPPLFFMMVIGMFVVSIILMVSLMRLMKKCSTQL